MSAGAPTILENVSVTVGGTALTDVKKVTIDTTAEAKDRTVFGDSVKRTGAGLKAWTITLEGIHGFGASESHATLAGLVGTSVAVVIRKDSTAVVSATNPEWQATGIMMNQSNLDVEAGEDPTYSIEFMSAGTPISVLTVS